MAVYFLDSSAVVKRYVREIGTPWVQGLTAVASTNRIVIASVTAVEVIAAVTRRHRAGHTPSQEASRAILQFRQDLPRDFELIEIVPDVIEQAMNLAERHGLRGYDAMQLAGALALNSICMSMGTTMTFVSADGDLNAAARLESLTVDDPNSHP